MLTLKATGLQDENMMLMKREFSNGKNKNKVASLMCMKKRQLRKQLDSVRAKPLGENLEESIMDWIIFR